jgi:hypothetical protein
MRVALLTSFAASRKEPLAEVVDRVRQAFLDAGMGEPVIQFNFGDSPIPGGVSSVDRVVKRFPDLGGFVTAADPMPGITGTRRISNGPLSPAGGQSIPFETLHAIAAGVPRSFPFHGIALLFSAEAFGEMAPAAARSADLLPGVLVTDAWWVNGRLRSLSACTVVEAEPTARNLPPLPERVAQVLAACGKVKRTIQAPLPDAAAAAQAIPVRSPAGALMASADPEAAARVRPIVADYRGRMTEIVAAANLPHVLPTTGDAYVASHAAQHGPLKPALERQFAPMGYSIKGGSGTFTLRRRTGTNLTVELSLDVGTWSHSAMAILKVLGLGFKATLILPVTAGVAVGAQYPIGDAEQWARIVDNLGALERNLDRTFVPEIERAAGPSPEWYVPDR